jgi:hypothetical protein
MRKKVRMRHYSTAKRKMDQLREISTFKKLEQKLQGMEYDEFNEWLKSIGLLHNHRNCNSCGEPMKQQKAKGRAREGCWLLHDVAREGCCQHRNCPSCSKDVGFYRGTFFEGAKLIPSEVFRY